MDNASLKGYFKPNIRSSLNMDCLPTQEVIPFLTNSGKGEMSRQILNSRGRVSTWYLLHRTQEMLCHYFRDHATPADKEPDVEIFKMVQTHCLIPCFVGYWRDGPTYL